MKDLILKKSESRQVHDVGDDPVVPVPKIAGVELVGLLQVDVDPLALVIHLRNAATWKAKFGEFNP